MTVTETTQLNVRVPLPLKRKIKDRARKEGTKLETFVEGLLVRGLELPAEEEAASPFKTKKEARDEWDRQLKKLPPEMRDAWKEENPRP